MLPFCGYNMSDYFSHWLALGEKLEASGAKLPGIFCVNWFRTDDNGKFVWPGFGENMRVLKWMLERLEGEGGGKEHVFGVTPTYSDLSWEGIKFSEEQFDKITAVDEKAWKEELKLHDELFELLKAGMPQELVDVKRGLKERLSA
jgi:phosphoenolpyruvate carboxykinase (GTP)